MSGRGGRGRGGRGNRGRHGGSNKGRGHNYNNAGSSTKKGLCTTLGSHVFDYGQKAAADQMRTTWEKIVQMVGTTYGHDICNELQNKATVTVVEPVHTDAVLARHTAREQIVRNGQTNIQNARRAQLVVLQAAVQVVPLVDPDSPMKLAILENEIAQGEFDSQSAVPIELTDSEKTQIQMHGVPTENEMPTSWNTEVRHSLLSWDNAPSCCKTS